MSCQNRTWPCESGWVVVLTFPMWDMLSITYQNGEIIWAATLCCRAVFHRLKYLGLLKRHHHFNNKTMFICLKFIIPNPPIVLYITKPFKSDLFEIRFRASNLNIINTTTILSGRSNRFLMIGEELNQFHHVPAKSSHLCLYDLDWSRVRFFFFRFKPYNLE